MATITALSEDFEGGGNGAHITTTNSFFTSTQLAAPMQFTTADAISGTRSATLGTLGSTSANMVEFPAATDPWLMFYLKIVTTPTTISGIVTGYEGDTTKLFDVRLTTANQLQYRSVSTTRWTSTALATNAWHRVAINVSPDISGAGSARIKIYSGTNLHSISASQDSTSQQLVGLAATCDNFRFGAISSDTTMQYLLDYVRGDTDTEPASITGGVPVNWVQGREVRIG